MQQILNWHREHRRHLTVGERAADTMRNSMGSWRFVFSFLIFMGLWALYNTHDGWQHFDKFPFILLNLFLSMLAGLQGAILLIAAKRADAVSAAMAEHDYRTNVAAAKDIEKLIELNQQQLAMIHDLSQRVNALSKK